MDAVILNLQHHVDAVFRKVNLLVGGGVEVDLLNCFTVNRDERPGLGAAELAHHKKDGHQDERRRQKAD